MKVITVSGPSGAGKTEMLNEIRDRFRVAPETYMSLNKHGLDNRLVLSKWGYICWWFDRVLSSERLKVDHIITDRSPLDTVAYVSTAQSELLALLTRSFEELAGRGHSLHHILVTASYKVLSLRVAARLVAEPLRHKYNESDEAHARRALAFFDDYKLWEEKIDTSRQTQQQAALVLEQAILRILGRS